MHGASVAGLPLGQALAVGLVTLLAVMSPGPDFAMVVRNSYLHGRGAGLRTAAGIALGVQVHVAYTIFGVAVLLLEAPLLLGFLKLLGAAYLVHIGVQTLRAGGRLAEPGPARSGDGRGAFATGFLCNALNPKTMLFVVSVFTQVAGPSLPRRVAWGCGLFISAAHLAWFSVVAPLLSRAHWRGALLRRQARVERLIGCVLIGLGLALAVSNLGTGGGA